MIRLVIAGLGRAGSGYGAADRHLGIHRSHIGAAVATDCFDIVGVVDPDPSAIETARRLWGASLMHSASALNLDALSIEAVDVIALATPPSDRVEQVKAALRHRPRLLLLEKPLARTVADAERIVTLCDSASVDLRVNYHRATDPAYSVLRRSIAETPLRVSAFISGGLFNYGSHLVDLLLDWFGPITQVSAAAAQFHDDDPILDFRMTVQLGFDCVVQAVKSPGYDLFELDILFPSSRLILANGGVERSWYRPRSGLHYPGYSQLARSETTVGLVGGLDDLYRSIARSLDGQGALSGCDGHRALAGIQVLDAALASAKMGHPMRVPYRH